MRKAVLVAVGIIVTALVVFVLLFARSLTTDSAIQRFNATATALAAVAGILTFGVLVVYTIETHNLRTVAQRQAEVAQQQVKEAQIQNETAIRPILGFDVSERQQVAWTDWETSKETTQTVNDAFVMRNLGSGPAFNIQTECDPDDIRLDVGSTILGQGQTVPVGVVVFPETPEQRTFDAVFRILPVYQNGKLPERIEIKLTCESTNRTRHETRFSLVYNPETDALWIEFLAAK
jgi:uncharacterized membrane protein